MKKFLSVNGKEDDTVFTFDVLFGQLDLVVQDEVVSPQYRLTCHLIVYKPVGLCAFSDNELSELFPRIGFIERLQLRYHHQSSFSICFFFSSNSSRFNASNCGSLLQFSRSKFFSARFSAATSAGCDFVVSSVRV